MIIPLYPIGYKAKSETELIPIDFGWFLQNHQITDRGLKDTNRETVRNAVLPLFTTNNMLHLSISWTDVTIRLVPTTDSFVIVESHNNLHEYGHTSQVCYP